MRARLSILFALLTLLSLPSLASHTKIANDPVLLALNESSNSGDGTVVEFYNSHLDHYFITADASEATQIDNGSAGAWERTGNTFNAGGSTPVCRFYGSLSPGPNSHFYTVSTAECADLKAQQASTPATQKRWNFESFDFNTTPPVSGVCPNGTTPVYRAYNNGYARGVDSNHRITNSQTAIQQVQARGWIDEGTVMCAPQTLGLPASDPVAYQGSFPPSTPSGFVGATLVIGGASRDVLIYRPGGKSGLPLLIFFSGTGATLDYNIADEIGREGLRAFADQEGVIVAIPIPRLMSRGDWDNHWSDTPYWETATTDSIASPVSADPEVNPDLLLTRAMIKETLVRYSADASRVYLNGFSNGAFFSYFAAATLGDRIAAFAETGGGLVLSNTVPYAGSSGEARSCQAAGWLPGLCAQPGAMPRPIAPAAVMRVPPAFLEANDNDDSVPFAHTCNLSASLPTNTPQQTRIRHSGLGHALNEGYLANSWNFMKEYRIPTVGKRVNLTQILMLLLD
jgi:poly(3-hydroxybutyrate) depolymerase